MSFARKLSNKNGKYLLDTVTKAALDAFKTVIKKVAYKAAQKTGEFIRNKITDKIVKPKAVPQVNSGNLKNSYFTRKKEKKC